MSGAAGPALDRVAWLVLDSVGVGGAPDRADFGDDFGPDGADTLGHVAAAVGGLRLPNLERLGLGNVAALAGRAIAGVAAVERPDAAYGRARERAAGKDTTSGHWELAGVTLAEPFATYPDGFPPELIDAFAARAGRGVLGNVAASGTEILDRLGEEHLRTGKLIVYTSADSVFQVAAHEDVVPPDELHAICRMARELCDPYRIGRVIARPFVGAGRGRFERTPRRRDVSLPPPRPTVLGAIAAAGLPVVGVGKIWDIFAGRGVTTKRPTESNRGGVAATCEALAGLDRGLVMTNLIDFDSRYGHRRDAAGYARCLEELDALLPSLLAAVGPRDLLLLTADHGNDPTAPGTDHTREEVPVLAYGPPRAAGTNLGVRATFADLGATVAAALDVDWSGEGTSFLEDIA